MAKAKRFRAKWESRGWILKGFLYIKNDEVHFKPDFGGNTDNIHIPYEKIAAIKKWKKFIFTKGIKVKFAGGTKQDPAPIYEIGVKNPGKIIKMINRRIDALEKLHNKDECDDFGENLETESITYEYDDGSYDELAETEKDNINDVEDDSNKLSPGDADDVKTA